MTKYYITSIGAWSKSWFAWGEREDGTAFDIKIEDIPKDAIRIYI